MSYHYSGRMKVCFKTTNYELYEKCIQELAQFSEKIKNLYFVDMQNHYCVSIL